MSVKVAELVAMAVRAKNPAVKAQALIRAAELLAAEGRRAESADVAALAARAVW